MNLRELSKKELKVLIQQQTREVICIEYNISERTLGRILKEKNLINQNYGPKGLSDADVMLIRNRYITEDVTQQTLAKEFKVSQAMICKIVNTKTTLKLGGTATVKLGFNYAN